MSDHIDRAEFRRAINEAIGWDNRKKVASVYQEHGGRFTDGPMPHEALLAVARWGAETALAYADHDDLLATPEHDAAVAAKALRGAANEVTYAVDWWDAPESVESWLHERADRIERAGGE